MDVITIRPIADITDADHLIELVRLVWGSAPEDLIPNHITITLAKNGGLVLGAYAPDGPASTGGMVGLALGWLGVGIDPADPTQTPKLKYCSHMVGVHPDWQGKHVGLRLKLAQREHLLRQGLTDWMTWTYDPLLRVNGSLNIHRLGATCSTYLRNAYGELDDDLNRSMPSDRCQVDWRLNSPHVLHDIEPQRPVQPWDAHALHIVPTTTSGRGLPAPVDTPLVLDGRPLAIPLPDDIAALRGQDYELALAWRFALREMLEAAFGAGYTMVDCVNLRPNHSHPDWRYILVREYQ